MTTTLELPMKREESLLNLLCLIVAAAFLALVVYNLFEAGSIISTDGLFFTVVPLVLALSLLAVPLQQVVSRRLERRALARVGDVPQIKGTTRAMAPALKDAKGRAMPPDVNRIVAEMKHPAQNPHR